jgi:large subunit ribosomal protein L10
MALTKQKKSELLGVLENITKDSGSIVFVHAKGMTVADTMKMRDTLAANGSGFKVVKKSLLKRALASAGITGDMPTLDGEMAVAYSKDLTAPAREVLEFRKEI